MSGKQQAGSAFLYDDNNQIVGIKNPDGTEVYLARFATQVAAAARVTADAALAAADLFWLAGAGAPVDYTDGDPAATGEGTAGIGSLYTNTTNGKLYVNGGTKAQPIWKLVTSAA
jgi:hypothetical protein